MLYPIVRPMAAFAFQIFFEKIYMNGLAAVPKDKPVMLVANHPTTFIEPCILACFSGRPVYYLVRGDFFENPIFGALMRDLHMIPIYRMKDGGYGNLKNNYGTFAACQEWLAEHKTVMVLAEGSAIYEKRLRPLRKGASRIAMGTLERFPALDLYVVPVGVNFTNSNQFGSQAMINFDEPFLAQEYYKIFKEKEAKGNRAFTDKLRERLKANIVIIDKESDDWLTNQLLDMQRNNHPVSTSPKVLEDYAPFKREKKVADWVNQLDEDQKQTLKASCKAYDKALTDNKVNDEILANPKKYQSKSALVLLLGAIPAGLGYLLNVLPFQLMRYIVNNVVVYNEFFGSVRIAASIGTFLVYYLILLVALLTSYGFKGILYFAAVPLLGYLTIKYDGYFKKWLIKQRFNRLSATIQEALTKSREVILQAMSAV